MKMVLGTAQFGLDYGISNQVGVVSTTEIALILQHAKNLGFSGLDSAAVYGDSERQLGSIPASQDYAIYTKLPALVTSGYEGWHQTFCQSLAKLKRNFLNGLFLHEAKDLLGSEQKNVYRFLSKLKVEGLINQIGVFVYSVDELEYIIERYKIDIVQLPLNIFDQRFTKNGFLKKLKEKEIEIQARSIFLQGLLLMSLNQLPFSFLKLSKNIKKLDELCKKQNISRLACCLAYVLKQSDVDALVLGVTSFSELFEIAKEIEGLPSIDACWDDFLIEDKNIIIPKNWRH